MGKRNYEWPLASEYDGAFTQDKLGGVTESVTPPVLLDWLSSNNVFVNKNYAVNGGFQVWQRGDSFIDPDHNSLTADNWRMAQGGGGGEPAVFDVTKEVGDTPTGGKTNSLKVEVTTSAPVLPYQTEAHVRVAVEGYDFQDLYGGNATLSFWVKSNIIGTYSISVHNRATTKNYIADYTILVANTWEKKTITIPFTGLTDTDWDFDGLQGFRIRWGIYAEAFYQGPLGWSDGNYTSSQNQVNLAANVGNYLQLAEVKIEKGSTSTPFIYQPYQKELSKCKRYYELVQTVLDFYSNASGQYQSIHIPWSVEKAITPITITQISGPLDEALVDNADILTSHLTQYGGKFRILSNGVGRCYSMGAIYGISADL